MLCQIEESRPNLVPALKPDGILAIVERDPEKVPGVSANEATARDVLIRQAGRAGFHLVRTEDFMSQDTLYIFTVTKEFPG